MRVMRDLDAAHRYRLHRSDTHDRARRGTSAPILVKQLQVVTTEHLLIGREADTRAVHCRYEAEPHHQLMRECHRYSSADPHQAFRIDGPGRIEQTLQQLTALAKTSPQ